jgi:pimeloyl-ACP methyl ester carboxylesterase
MPTALLPHVTLHYELYGPSNGVPLLLLAPGGLRSHVGLWRHTHDGLPRPWPDPTVELARDFRIVAVDQRNAGGRSPARVGPDDGWQTYAADHLGVLDHLGIDRFHVMGACIGSSFALKLAETAPRRVLSAVLQAPIGWTAQNVKLTEQSFEAWAQTVRAQQPATPEAHLRALRENLFSTRDFVFSVTRDFVRRMHTPLLVLAGDDAQHPAAIAEEIASLASDSRLMRDWKGPARRTDTIDAVLGFLRAHAPAEAASA